MIAQALHPALHDNCRVVGRPATCDLEHVRGFFWTELAKVGFAGLYIAQFCRDIARPAWATDIDERQVVPMLQSDVILYKKKTPSSQTLSLMIDANTLTHF